jgi:hypothetical protein
MENKTKKQQEWRELVAKTKDEELYKTPTGYLIEHIEIWDGAKMVGGAFSISNEIISQLLSERTFTKEELRVIKSDLSLVVSDFGVNDESFYENLIAKIGKLLKEEE